MGIDGKDLKGPFQILELDNLWVCWLMIDNLKNQAQKFEIRVEAAAWVGVARGVWDVNNDD